MSDIIKNLNYSAEEINDILASVATKARTVDLEELKLDTADMTNLMHDYMEEKNAKFDKLEKTIGSFEGRLSDLSTAHTTLSENFSTKSTEIDGKFTDIDSDISAIKENISTILEYINTERTTLSDYGITDVKIEEGVITIGEKSITPATSDELSQTVTSLTALIEEKAASSELSEAVSLIEGVSEEVSVLQENISNLFKDKTTLADYGITDVKIEDGVITLGENTITPATPEELSQAVTDLTALIEEKADESALAGTVTVVEGIAEDVETLTTNLLTTDSNVSALQELVDGLFTNKSTLAAYGIGDAKIEEGVVTLGEVTIEPLTKDSWEEEKQELLSEIEKLKNRLDILEAPDHTLVDSAGNIFASKDGNYFVTK